MSEVRGTHDYVVGATRRVARATLEDCLEALIDYRGKTPRKVDAGIPLVTAKVVKSGRIETPNEFITEEDYDSWMTRGFPEVGDVLLTTEAPLGEVAQIKFLPVALAQRIIALRGKQGILDSTYLLYLLQSEEMQAKLHGRSTGTTVIGIKQSELRKIEVDLPPLPEQRAIAHILGALDDKIDLNRRTNETLEAMARALFKSWFVDFDGVAQEDMQESELGLIPKGWRVGSFAEVVEIIGGGTPKTSIDEFWNGDIPWFSVVDTPASSDVFVIETEKSITKAGLQGSSVRMIDKGITIISARGTVGNLAIAGRNMTFNQSCYGLKGKNGAGDFFVYLSAQRMVEQLKAMAHGSVFSTITRQTFDAIHVVLPLGNVFNQFEQAVSTIFDTILINVKQSRTLATLRDTLLPKLLSGELRVPELVKMEAENAESSI